jgi:hypothetical protein
MLKFSRANAKLRKLQQKMGMKLYSLSLPSGWSCPAALLCKSKAVVNPLTGRATIQDGPQTIFRCYSASQEVLYPDLRKLTEHNYSVLRKENTMGGLVSVISNSIPRNAWIIRVHESGDFYSELYFQAWCKVAELNSAISFYAYTKSLNYWIKNKDLVPDNLKLTASYGGAYDSLIEEHNLPYVKVVNSIYAARKQKLPVDKTDYHAYKGTQKFALLLHGPQKKGTAESKAWERIKKTSGGYSRGNKAS